MPNAIHPQYITDEHGNRVSVVVSIQEWQMLLNKLEEADDIRLYDEVKARNESAVSLAEYRRNRQQPNG